MRLSTSSDATGTSIAPVASLGFSVPAGRERTRPRTRTTNSLRSDSASVERRGVGRIEGDLRDAVAVAQVDEDQAAVVAAAMHPAGELDVAADVVGARALRTRRARIQFASRNAALIPVR